MLDVRHLPSMGRRFFNLLHRCFPLNHQLRPIINRNTVKLSYSCMPNIQQKISNHNKKLLNPSVVTNNRDCNCRNATLCPMEGKCLTSSIIYQASVTRSDNYKTETYVGLTENAFKTRYNSHRSSFNNIRQRHATTLSQYIWDLKDKNIPYSLKWKILTRSRPYSNTSKKCNLCLTEKYYIIFKHHMASLNTKNELASSCRHSKKHLLGNCK